MAKTEPGRTLMRMYRTMFRRFGPQRWWPARTRFEVIVGMVLTQNTAWTNVEKAVRNLRARGALTYKGMRELPEHELAELIRPAGYYNIKARRLKNVLTYLSDSCGGNLSRLFRRDAGALREELLGVNGLGPESVDSILLYAGNKPVFVVDAYTRRIFSRHGLVDADAGYDEVQHMFATNLPGEPVLFNEYHALIVATAKEFCRTRARCAECPLSRFLHIDR